MISEPQLLRKITRRLIPFMFVLYIVSYLDRVNVSFASLQMNAALGFSARIYALGAGIFFIGYFLFEVPSNLILHRVGARLWMARILVTWGVISSAMMFVKGTSSFYALRFLLGIAEAGFFPGMILYLTYWFPAHARGRAVGRFMTATAVASVIGGPLSGLLLEMDGWQGLSGWQWLFLIEGLPAVLLGFITFVYLPDGPKNAKWLNTEEKKWIEDTLERERQQTVSGGQHSMNDAMRSGRVWTFAMIYFAIIMSFYGITFWLPQIVQGFSGMRALAVGLITTIPWIGAAIGMVLLSRNSDASGERRWHVAMSAVGGAAGLIAAGLLHNPMLELAALSLAAAGIWGTLGPFWALSSESLAGTGAAAGIALINSVGNLGGFLGPYLVGWIRDRTGSFTLALVALAMFPLVGALVTLSSRHATSRLRSGAMDHRPINDRG
jgi:ACS family tartrate transporter-like MFS transporter